MPVRDIIEGRAALIVVDIQAGCFVDPREEDADRSIPIMRGFADRMRNARPLIDKARETGVPVVFIQEVHRPDGVDFGRELDGAEAEHCVEGDPGTPLAVAEMGVLPSDYVVPKRRYSAFFGTDLEILLKGLKAETLILVGGLTDVCVHYTFVDGHQHDYFVRVAEDCVAGSSEAAHEASLKAMEYLQFGARRSSVEIMAAFEASAGRP